ncbi:hypothetical protein [Burkholderia gladioli]|uniref:hypothetical protein n=1 Tax=Burkholderia gladioli TaxID=28095 RepID=UPI00164065C2|nr:hypothetical protein [Burkholderia gladioli]MBU9384208.1 hypothetical protein [Burkholderia gladioli]
MTNNDVENDHEKSMMAGCRGRVSVRRPLARRGKNPGPDRVPENLPCNLSGLVSRAFFEGAPGSVADPHFLTLICLTTWIESV